MAIKAVKKDSKKSVKVEKVKEFELKVPWWVWALVILAIAGIIFYVVFASMSTFVYKGMAFTKENYGKNLMIYKYSYYYQNSAGETIKYNMYIHTDPRKNNVPFDGSQIEFDQKGVKLSVDAQGLSDCGDSRAAIGQLTQFIVNNDFNITVGTPDLEQARKFNASVTDCGTHPNDFMIVVKRGDTSEVGKEGDSCYNIQIAECEDTFAAVEKFMVEAVAQAREKANMG